MGHKKHSIEVISCIANKHQARQVLEAGADAIYAGLKNRSWYNSKIELSWEDLLEAADIVHEYGKKLYIAINRDLSDGDVDEILSYSQYLEDKTFDGLIVSDWGCIAALRRRSPNIEIHLSANTACVNPSDFRLARQLGIQRVVFSPSLKFKEMKTMVKEFEDFEWEAITYGGICFSEVSHCPCQVENNGKVFHDTCRHEYIFLGNGNNRKKPESFGMPHLDGGVARDLYRAGVYHWKIEGRAKGIKHIVEGTRTLRTLADQIQEEC